MTDTRPFTESGLQSPERRRRSAFQFLAIYCLRECGRLHDIASEAEGGQFPEVAEDARLLAEEFRSIAIHLRQMAQLDAAIKPLMDASKRDQAND